MVMDQLMLVLQDSPPMPAGDGEGGGLPAFPDQALTRVFAAHVTMRAM